MGQKQPAVASLSDAPAKNAGGYGMIDSCTDCEHTFAIFSGCLLADPTMKNGEQH